MTNYKVQLVTRFGTVLEEHSHKTTKDARKDISRHWPDWCNAWNDRGFFSAEVVAARDDLQVIYVKNKSDCLAMTKPSQKRAKRKLFTLDKTDRRVPLKCSREQ
jgi:ketosteroid isomerase-like protein